MLLVGRFENIPLGSAYASDEDDWDIGDKTFSFAADNDVQFFRYRTSFQIRSVELLHEVRMGVDLDQKVGGGTKSENYWFENPSFLKPSKTSKVQILGVLFFLFVLQFIVLIKFNFIF